jgi:hypothetical protein
MLYRELWLHLGLFYSHLFFVVWQYIMFLYCNYVCLPLLGPITLRWQSKIIHLSWTNYPKWRCRTSNLPTIFLLLETISIKSVALKWITTHFPTENVSTSGFLQPKQNKKGPSYSTLNSHYKRQLYENLYNILIRHLLWLQHFNVIALTYKKKSNMHYRSNIYLF